MIFHTVLFDLDGTLTDPGEGITNSVAYALKRFGVEVESREGLFPFIGPPLHQSFMRYYNMDEQRAFEAVEIYREYFSRKGMMENRVYDGIEDLLSHLKETGKRLLVATSKPEVYSIKILEHFGLSKYFEVISGALLHPPKNYGKADVIRDALERAGILDLNGVIMVGDRSHDIIGAHQVGLPAVGVLYGYGDRAEHEDCGADYIVNNVLELKDFLCSN